MITANEMKIGGNLGSNDFEPVYAVKGSMTMKGIRRFIKLAFSQYGHLIHENIPETLRKKYRLLNRRDALHTMHFPANQERFKAGKKTICL